MKPGVMKQRVSGLQFSREGFSRRERPRQDLFLQDFSLRDFARQGGLPPRVDAETVQPKPEHSALESHGHNVTSLEAEPLKKRPPVVRISDPVQAILQLLALIIAMIAIGYYIVVYKPGVPVQGTRSFSSMQQERDR